LPVPRMFAEDGRAGFDPILKRHLPSLRGAKRRSNPDLFRSSVDCFASLAMTMKILARHGSALDRGPRDPSQVHYRA
jgi:hypothetical protein